MNQHYFWPGGKCSRLLVSVMLLLFQAAVHAQEFKILKVSTTDYPYIKITFVAKSSLGEKIYDAQPADFSVTENRAKADIVNVTNPSQIYTPASIVLVLDVSNSMTGLRIALAKRTAKAFIEQIPLDKSEVAVLSFNDKAYVNCDFTQDQDRLMEAIDNVQPTGGGTSYTEAFMNKTTGALSVIRNGINKKCIIFLTDGLSDTNPDDVIALAKLSNTTVYCVSMELPMPDVLKKIVDGTGGKYFQAKASASQLETIYNTIFLSLEVAKYGTVTWLASNDCKPSRNVQLLFRKIPVSFDYDVPANKTGLLEADPSLLSFGTAPSGTTKNLSVDLVARNIPLTITNFTFQGNKAFFLGDSLPLPVKLKPNQYQNVIVGFKEADEGVVTGKLSISTLECPDRNISLVAGNEEKLRLICPKGGEKFIVGIDTVVRWEGVKKNTEVAVLYRTDSQMPWKPAGQAAGGTLPWIIPNDTSRKVQVMLQPSASANTELYLTSTMPNQRSGLRTVYFSSDGKQLISTDNQGIVKTWLSAQGSSLATLDGFYARHALFGINDKSIHFFSGDEIITWDIPSQRVLSRVGFNNKVILTSYVLPNGQMQLLPCNLTRDNANTAKVYQPVYDRVQFIFEKELVRSASITPDGSRVLLLDGQNALKIWDVASKTSNRCSYQPINPVSVVISPNGKTAMVVNPGTVAMIDMDHGNELFHMQQVSFVSYSNSGDMVILKSAKSGIVMADSYTGRILRSLENSHAFKFLDKGYSILLQKGDSLIYYDVSRQKKIYGMHCPNLTEAVISPDYQKLMVIRDASIVQIFNLESGTLASQLGDIDNTIRTGVFSPDGKSVVLIMNDYSMQYWSSQGRNQSKEVVSGYFSILSPKPVVKKEIKFGDQAVHQPRELTVSDFIVNPTEFPLLITKLEIFSDSTSSFVAVSATDSLVVSPATKLPGEFRFTPAVLGIHKGWIRTYTPTDTFLTALSGNGVIPSMDLLADDIDFGKQKVFQTVDSAVTILRNISKSVIHVTAVSNSGPDKKQFVLLSQIKDQMLQPQDSLVVKVRFAPVRRGITSGTLTVCYRELSEPEIVNLTGEGIAPRSVVVRGRVLNSNDSTPVEAAVLCTDLLSNNTLKMASRKNGMYELKLNADRNYGLLAEKPGYISTSENLDMRQALVSDTLERNLFLTPLKAGAIIRMNCVFFEFAKATLQDISRNDLNRLVEIMKRIPSMQIEIQGHTDFVGTDASNMALSRARANSVKEYLVKHGIAASRLTISAFGESKPVASNSTEEGRQLNRRVEIKIARMQ